MKFRMNRRAGLAAGTALTIGAMLAHTTFPAAGLVAMAGVLTLPGFLILEVLRVKQVTALERGVLAVALSLLTLMVSGLGSNLLVPLLGNQQPLATNIQAPWTGLVLLGLLAAAWWRGDGAAGDADEHSRWELHWDNRTLTLGIGLATLPALAAAGAAILNGGGTNLFTMAVYALIAVWAVALVAWHRLVPRWVWPWAIFCMALAMLWSTSLRGQYITGHDIQLEYYVFRLTDAAKHWTMANFQDAYNACLSITILPTVLKSLSGIDAVQQYKVVFQALFALASAGVVALSWRVYKSRVLAFLAGFIFITFPTFVTDMPMLVRQETAFMFFIALLMVVMNRAWSVWQRRWLVAMLVAGIILSHYSTTFVTAGLFAGVLVLVAAARRWVSRRGWKETAPRNSGITWGLLGIILAGTMVWTGLYTRTGGNITATARHVATQLPELLSPKPKNDSVQYSVVNSAHPSEQNMIDAYAESQNANVSPAEAAQGGLYTGWQTYHLQATPEPSAPATRLGRWLQKLGLAPGAITNTGKQLYALGLQAAIFLGAVVVVLWRKRWKLDADFVALAPVGIALLAVQVLVPIVDYGLFRALQQDMVFLSLPIALGLMKLLGWLKLGSQRMRVTLITAAFASAFLVLSGFVNGLVGGAGSSLPLSNSGFYYNAYYTDSQDASLFSWLKTNYQAGYPINTDTFLRMKIMANTGITTVDGLTPGDISKPSYVVLAGENVTADRVSLYFGGQLMAYQYPTGFLDNNKNLIYSTNETKVYH
jgi:uncharacterized membrane protein